MALELQMFDTAEQAAQALAGAVASDLQQALANSLEPIAARALLLVSGGRTPLPFFSALSQQHLPWQQIDVSLVDERSVPPAHADANAGLVMQYLLQGAAAQASFIPLMASDVDESDPVRWAQRSAQAANAKLELAQPAAIVLGLGADGHTASLFADAPQWREASETESRYVALTPSHAPHPRVSLSLHALIAQRKLYVWSSGAEKLEVIQQSQALVGGVAEGLIDGVAMCGAGPFTLLLAHPEVTLRVFHAR